MRRTALITGGTRGIGAAIAKEFKKKGFEVIASYYANEAVAQNFIKETGIPSIKWDVSNYDACQQAIADITNQYGPIDILVNNAGITRDGFLHKSTLQMWQEVINTNLSSCFNTTHCVLSSMRERNYGRIINISSINAQKGQVGQVNYSAAKAGVIGFTRALALECASKGITVNAIAPGYVDTDMVKAVPVDVLQKIIAQIPVGRLGRAEEIAHVAVFLASEESSFINGATVTINGGQYIV